MKETDGNPVQTILSQIELIDESQKFILLIVLGIVLSYFATTIQKRQLCCSIDPCAFDNCDCLPDTFPLRIASSTLVLIAVVYFYIISDRALCDPRDTCMEIRSANYNNTASLFVLIAAVIRIVDLIQVHFYEERINGNRTI